jgi:hypothetical protein
MVEGMYVIGVKPKSLGEGVTGVASTMDYTTAYVYWQMHPGMNYGIYRWSGGGYVNVGRKMRDKLGRPHWVPIPPWNIQISA